MRTCVRLLGCTSSGVRTCVRLLGCTSSGVRTCVRLLRCTSSGVFIYQLLRKIALREVIFFIVENEINVTIFGIKQNYLNSFYAFS